MAVEDEIFFQPPLVILDKEQDEPLAYIALPYSSLEDELISEGTIYEEVARNSSLFRLRGIRALSFLSLVGPFPEVQEYREFSHTRYLHSLLVARVGEHILRRNQFSEQEIVIAVIAYLLHDIATPALGDATMKMDPENLSEEENFKKTVGEMEEALFRRHGTTTDEIESIILNNGALGQVLDMADRIVYTAMDLGAILDSDRLFEPASEDQHSENSKNLETILDVARKFPKFADLYKSVGVNRRTGEVFFSEPEMLASFLHVRALLHERLYLHPVSQGRDLLVLRLIEKYYTPEEEGARDLLTPTKLRKYSDNDLMKELTLRYFPEYSSDQRYFFDRIVNWMPQYAKFDDMSSAQEFADQLSNQPDIKVIGVQERRDFNAGTSYSVIHPATRSVMTLHDYDPKLAEEPERIASSMPAVFVYYKELKDDGSQITELLRNVL